MPLIVAIVVALIALAVAIAAWFRPPQAETPASPQYTDQQVADAKKNICDAYDASLKAINAAGTLNSEDPNQKFMLGMHTRIAFNTAADYLSNKARMNPSAPADLLNEVQLLASSYQDMVLAHIAQRPQEDIDKIYREIDANESEIKKACG